MLVNSEVSLFFCSSSLHIFIECPFCGRLSVRCRAHSGEQQISCTTLWNFHPRGKTATKHNSYSRQRAVRARMSSGGRALRLIRLGDGTEVRREWGKLCARRIMVSSGN